MPFMLFRARGSRKGSQEPSQTGDAISQRVGGTNERSNFISSRELAFFGLQAIIPAVFALAPALVFLIGFSDIPNFVEKLTDGTLVLVAFTMLISLSQDLTHAVRPFQKKDVARLELLLRVSAIVILAAYMFLQPIPIIFREMTLYNDTNPAISIPIRGSNSFLYSLSNWISNEGIVQIVMMLMALLCFLLSAILCRRILLVLRPHFVD